LFLDRSPNLTQPREEYDQAALDDNDVSASRDHEGPLQTYVMQFSGRALHLRAAAGAGSNSLPSRHPAAATVAQSQTHDK